MAASVAGVLAGVPTVASAFSSSSVSTTTVSSEGTAKTATTVKSGQHRIEKTSAAAVVRVVAPGERVQVKPGFVLWLTKDGKHWSTPEGANQFRSVADGNQTGGASVQVEVSAHGTFLSGVYIGKGDAASIVVHTRSGDITGSVLTLAGKPGWSAWYATSPLRTPQIYGDGVTADGRIDRFVRGITVYDTTGKIISQTMTPTGKVTVHSVQPANH